MFKLFRNAQISVFVFYLFTSIAGFLSLGDENKNYDLIILRKPLKNSKDIAMKISISRFLKSISCNYFHRTNHTYYTA